MKPIKVVAFDCDGVMFDSIKANTEYYNQILKHFDKPPLSPEQFDYTHMHTGDDAIAYLFKEKQCFKSAQNYRHQMGYRRFISYMKPEPHLVSLLKWLKPRCRTAIATNRADTIEAVLEEFGLEEYFDRVVSSADVSRPKPDPEILNIILDHFNADSKEAVYVGDSSLDEQAAKAAGVHFVAFNNASLSADNHIKTLNQLQNLLNGNLKR